MPKVLGIDSSTQSTKVELRDVDSGALLASGRAAHTTTTPPVSEQDPQMWLRALQDACSSAAIDLARVDAVSIAGQQHGMVVMGDDGRVLRPAKLWNDTESAPDAAWLLDQLDAEAWAQRVGSVPVAAFTIAKLSWLHRREPEVWKRVERVCLPHDWLTFQLTGEFVTDRGDASGTGYWSPGAGRYDTDVLAIVDGNRDWMTALPRVCDVGETLPSLQGDGVVASGTGDNMAAALGIGLQDHQVAISLGTSGTAYARSTTPTADDQGEVAGFADATGAYLPLVCTLNATKVTDWVATLLGVDRATMEQMVLDTDRADRSHRVVVVPYFDGERTPNLPNATGEIVGVRSTTSRAEIARAAYEGVVCGLLQGVDALQRVGVRAPQEILLVGGGAQSSAYRQVLADVSQLPVRVPHGTEHVAMGACVQAAAAMLGETSETIADGWALRTGAEVVEPTGSLDQARAIRDTYNQSASRHG